MLSLPKSSERASHSTEECINTLSDTVSLAFMLSLRHGIKLTKWISSNQTSILVNIEVNVVHTDDTSDVVIIIRLQGGILDSLCPFKDVLWNSMEIFVGISISPKSFWDEPTRTMRLLPPDDE